MDSKLTESKVMGALDWAYDRALGGIPGFDSAQELAESYMKAGDCKISQANSLIRWQNAKAGTSGFLTGLGGIITMPVTVPANIASVMYVQLRMIAAIAHIGEHDIRDDRIKTMAYACLTGNAAKDILKDVGIVVGRKLTENAIKNISGKTITKINQAVGFRLFTKFGEKGAINLGKAVPLIGGIVGATFDSVTTNVVGNVARDTFVTTTNPTIRASGR
ncbi:EcsC family protein [Thermomonas mangrovi]|uniref:EcsC family protein n=1 Tax=Thermomonas mangrovi TaxID=2993316 RepID=UPI0023077BEB|nr:EcsC family protein [Thermomonas mangrovi]